MLDSLHEVLDTLRRQADEQESLFQNGLGAAGMRVVIHAVEEEILALGERLVDPDEAAKYSGMSKRNLRRIVRNHGSSRAPLYRLVDLPRKVRSHSDEVEGRGGLVAMS